MLCCFSGLVSQTSLLLTKPAYLQLSEPRRATVTAVDAESREVVLTPYPDPAVHPLTPRPGRGMEGEDAAEESTGATRRPGVDGVSIVPSHAARTHSAPQWALAPWGVGLPCPTASCLAAPQTCMWGAVPAGAVEPRLS